MLQIVTQMYFREGEPLHSTPQRMVLYTNLNFLRASVIELPVGELATATSHSTVSPVTATVIEYLEAQHLDGTRSALVATSGEELVDDLADVLSFGLNATFSRDQSLVRRLVPASVERWNRISPATMFRGTFEPARYVPDGEVEGLRSFMCDLLALERRSYEKAMRAIRQIVRATQSAVDNPTRAYVDLVAALESLSGSQNAPVATWKQMDGRKRTLIDEALAEAPAKLGAEVRAAVLQAERLGIKQRFVEFVLQRVSPHFYREDAGAAVRPVRGPDLERVVKMAYDVRSQNVHALRDLPPEAWSIGDMADTIELPTGELALSLEGLARLARHVVRAFVQEAPRGVDETFDWRDYLPGKLMMRLAPQYWVHQSDGLTHSSAKRYFEGMVDHTLDVLARREEKFQPLQGLMGRIEELVPGTASSPARTQMIGMYELWHALIADELRQPNADRFLDRYGAVLHRPSMTAFVVQVLEGRVPEWTSDEWVQLADERRTEREAEKAPQLAAVLDAALQAAAAEAAADAGDPDGALRFANRAIQELPGNDLLRSWETALRTAEPHKLELTRLMLGDEVSEGSAATS